MRHTPRIAAAFALLAATSVPGCFGRTGFERRVAGGVTAGDGDAGGPADGDLTSDTATDPGSGFTRSWDFTVSTDYTFDPKYVEVTQGVARLKSVGQTWATAADFASGTRQQTSWVEAAGRLERDAQWPQPLPDGAPDAGWTNMSGNVLLLHFNESAGASTFADTSGHDHDAVCAAGLCPTAGDTGAIGNAVTFDGVSDVVTIADAPELRMTTALTVEAWVMMDSFVSDANIIGKWNHQVDDSWDLQSGATNDESIDVYIADSPTDSGANIGSTPAGSFTAGTWHHVAFVYDGLRGANNWDRLQIFIDGVAQPLTFTGTIGASLMPATAPIMLGELQNSGEYFPGHVDEVAIFDRALTAGDVADHYLARGDAYFESIPVDAGGTVHWSTLSWVPAVPQWKALPGGGQAETAYAGGNVDMTGNLLLLHMDETTWASAVVDASGNAHHGTAVGGATTTAGGRFLRAGSFDGVDDAVTIPDDPGLTLTEGTLSLWAKASRRSGTLFRRASPVSAGLYLHGRTGGELELVAKYSGGVASAMTGGFVPLDGRWHHFAATFGVTNGYTNRLYVDGVQTGSGANAAAWTFAAEDVWLGSDGTGGELFQGIMDEVALWNRALNADEIGYLYQRGATRLGFQVRSCSTADCSGTPWVGPVGLGTAFYSEQQNASPGLPVVSFTGDVADNRYFQYRVSFYADDPLRIPAVQSIAFGPAHWVANSPTVAPVAGAPYQTLVSLGETLGGGNQGTVGYQLSPNGTDWYWFNGASWTAATSSAQTNSAAEAGARIDSFAADVGAGTFFFRAALHSQAGEEAVELDGLQVTGD